MNKLSFDILAMGDRPLMRLHVIGSDEEKPRILTRAMEVLKLTNGADTLLAEFPEEKTVLKCLVILRKHYNVVECSGIRWSSMHGHSIDVEMDERTT